MKTQMCFGSNLESDNRRATGLEDSDTVWFSLEGSPVKESNPKHAFQWALQTIGTAMNYTEMYSILASTANSVNKDPKQFRERYEQLQEK